MMEGVFNRISDDAYTTIGLYVLNISNSTLNLSDLIYFTMNKIACFSSGQDL